MFSNFDCSFVKENQKKTNDSDEFILFLDRKMYFLKKGDEIINIQNQNVQTSRNILLIQFFISKHSRLFYPLQPIDLFKTLSKQPKNILELFNSFDAQIFSRRIALANDDPNLLAKNIIQFFSDNYDNFSPFCSLTFPSLFCNYTTFDCCINAASVLIEFIYICSNNLMIHKITQPFLLSMYNFFDIFWYNFNEISCTLVKFNRKRVINFLSETLEKSCSLIELPFQLVISALLQKSPYEEQVSFLIKTLLYKTAKLYFNMSPSFAASVIKAEVLSLLKELYLHPNTSEAKMIFSFIENNRSCISIIPMFNNNNKIEYSPMIFSKCAAIEYCDILSENQNYAFSEKYLSTRDKYKKMILTPFSFKYYKIPSIGKKTILPTNILKEAEKIYGEDKIINQYYDDCFDNIDLFDKDVQIKQKVSKKQCIKLNHAIDLHSKTHHIEQMSTSINNFYFLNLSQIIFMILKDSTFASSNPKNLLHKILDFLLSLSNDDIFIIPYIRLSLNQINLNFEKWVTKANIDAYTGIIKDKNEFACSCLRSINHKILTSLISLCIGKKDIPLGDKFLLFLNLTEKIRILFEYQKEKKCEKNRDAIDFVNLLSYLIISSQDSSIYKSFLFIDNSIFKVAEYNALINQKVKRTWKLFSDAFWLIVSNDDKLAANSMKIDFM